MIRKAQQSPAIAKRQAEGCRLAIQMRREPIRWNKGEREALIAQALSAGRVEQCPAGHAEGVLVFNTGSVMHGSSFARKGALQ